ncbi:energy transducer TonB [Erythrobacter litoralis]|uniref:energy transducer TonB n=1 Tax=Erythrobacter litoralis TaxID=39960 RepID=UPI002435F4FC|nr:energy transducer TonB [Erythrobacter litoralis]
MVFRLISASAAVTLSFASPVYAQEGVVTLEPNGNWNLDFGEYRCRLARLFGTEEDKTIFYIEQTSPSNTFTWLVAGGLIERLGSARNIGVSFGTFPEQKFGRSDSYGRSSYDFGEFGNALTGIGYKPLIPNDEQNSSDVPLRTFMSLDAMAGEKIDHVSFSRRDRTVRLATGNMKAAFEALNTCTKDLYAFWGIDVEKLGNAVQGPRSRNMERVAQRLLQHYPKAAEQRGEDAIMNLKIIVGADGKVERCIAIHQTKAENFDNFACETMEKYAEFDPAVDAKGKPVRSVASQTVRYHTD